METGQLLSWLVSIVGFTGFIFAGKKKWWSWYINLGCQILWGAYALVTGQLAFLVFAAAYFVIFGVNAYKWTKDHLLVKRLVAQVVPYHNEEPEDDFIEDSNLVKHARTELTRIGEDDDVVNWYVRVIREYSTFGHSGGSAWATTATLTELLAFHPLAPLTNDPEEWVHHGSEVWGDPESNGIWQNRRDGRAFSKDGGETYTLVDDTYKIVHQSECNICWANKVPTNEKCPGCGKDFAERIRADL